MKIVRLGASKIGVADGFNDSRDGDVSAVIMANTLSTEVDLSGSVCDSEFCRKGKACSYRFGCPVICGCTTRLGDVKHISVFSFSRGKLADIASRTANITGDGCAESNVVKILRCSGLNLGLLIDTDVLLGVNWKKIAPYCDVVCAVAFKCTDADIAYIPTYSSLFALPYAVAYADGSLFYGTPEK